MIQVRWLTDLNQIRELGDRYAALLDRGPDIGLFYRLGWLERVWPFLCSRRRRRLAFLWADRDGEPLGLFPLMLTHKGWLQGGRRHLEWFGMDGSLVANRVPDLVIPDPDSREACIGAFIEHLHRHSDHWDSFELAMMPAHSPHVGILRANWPALRVVDEPIHDYALELSEGFDAYIASRSAKFRKTIRRETRRLDESGRSWSMHMTRAVDDRRWEDLKRIHTDRQHRVRRRRGKGRECYFEQARLASTFRNLLDWAAPDAVRHYWLEIDGQLEAFSLCFVNGKSLFYKLIGLSEAAEAFSANYILTHYLIERETREHATRWIRMLPGGNLYKERWATHHWPLVRLSADNTDRLVSRARCRWVHICRRWAKREP